MDKLSGGGGSKAANLYRKKRFTSQATVFNALLFCAEMLLVDKDKCLHIETLRSGKPVILGLTALPRLCLIGLL